MTKKSSFGRHRKASSGTKKYYDGDMKILHMGKWKDVRMCDSGEVCRFGCTITTFMNMARALKMIFIAGIQDCVVSRFAHLPSSFKRKMSWKMSDKKLTEYYNKAKNVYWYIKNVPCHQVTDRSGMKEIKKVLKSHCLPQAQSTICDIYNEIEHGGVQYHMCEEEVKNMKTWMEYVAGIEEAGASSGYDPSNPWSSGHNYSLKSPVEPLENGTTPKWMAAMIKLGFAKEPCLSSCVQGLNVFSRKGDQSYDLCTGKSRGDCSGLGEAMAVMGTVVGAEESSSGISGALPSTAAETGASAASGVPVVPGTAPTPAPSSSEVADRMAEMSTTLGGGSPVKHLPSDDKPVTLLQKPASESPLELPFGRRHRRRNAFGRPGEMTGHGWSATSAPMMGFVRPMRMSMAEKTTGMPDDAYMRHVGSATGSPVPLGAGVGIAQANNYYDSYGLGENVNPKFGRRRSGRKRSVKKSNYGRKHRGNKSTKKTSKNTKKSNYGRKRKTLSFGDIFF